MPRRGSASSWSAPTKPRNLTCEISDLRLPIADCRFLRFQIFQCRLQFPSATPFFQSEICSLRSEISPTSFSLARRAPQIPESEDRPSLQLRVGQRLVIGERFVEPEGDDDER